MLKYETKNTRFFGSEEEKTSVYHRKQISA